MEHNQQAAQKLRVVQWATGTVGRSALRAVIGHPDIATDRCSWLNADG